MSAETETEDLFEMANLFPRTTGLPMTVWLSARGKARHAQGDHVEGNRLIDEGHAKEKEGHDLIDRGRLMRHEPPK